MGRKFVTATAFASVVAANACLAPARAQSDAVAQNITELEQLSIEQLADMPVTSVSKAAEPLSSAPAAVVVVNRQDVQAEAIQSIPEALRLAPTLDVAQTSPTAYTIASRGLSGNSAAQNFPNKLLVLIDGRSVYSPLYSGVYWDLQNIFMDDLDRIEVISGPAGTLWGSNAVNGVINVTTQSSAQTQGGLLDVQGGTLGGRGGIRYGGRIDDNLTYRVYAMGLADRSSPATNGVSPDDGATSSQGGFRFDWARGADTATFQGDIYRVDEDRAGNPVERGRGGNVLGRWHHDISDDSSVQVQAYYDYVFRGGQGDAGAFRVSTYDVEAQYSFSVLGWNRIVSGIGERVMPYTISPQIGPATSLLFVPASRTLRLTDAFVEDHIEMTRTLELTLGVKVEDDPYADPQPMPSARIAWQPNAKTLLWGAISRAVRSPTPFDDDVVEKLGQQVFITGDPNFRPEGLTAYEVGYKGIIAPQVSLSVSGYWDVYDHLRSIEFSPTVFPLIWGNEMEGKIYGVQSSLDVQVAPWWRISAGLATARDELRFKPGSSGLLGPSQAGDDPHITASVRSLFNLGPTVTLDADLRYTGRRPDPYVAPLTELNTTVVWNAWADVQLYVRGANLLHDRHVEFSPGDPIERSVTAGARWHF